MVHYPHWSGTFIDANGGVLGADYNVRFYREILFKQNILMNRRTTIGFGDITASNTDDLAFTIVVIIIGTTLAASIIANIATIVHNVTISEDNFHHRVACMDRFISHRNLPNSFSVQCKKQFVNIWEATKGVNESRIARELMPVPIRNEIIELVQIPIIQKSLLFNFDGIKSPLSPGFVHTIAVQLHRIYVADTEQVLNGRGCLGMYILYDGSMKLFIERKCVTITAGNSFGEEALYGEECHLGCQAVSSCVLYVLHRTAFTALCADYPFEYDMLRQRAKEIANTRFNEVNRARHSSTMISNVNLSKVLSKIPAVSSPTEWTLPRFAPHDTAQKCWDSILLFVFISNCITIPLGIAFGIDDTASLINIYLGDFLYFVNIFLRGLFFSVMHGDKLLRSGKDIGQKYVYGTVLDKKKNGFKYKLSLLCKGELIYDFITILPLEFLIMNTSIASGYVPAQKIFLGRFLKLSYGRNASKYFSAFQTQMISSTRMTENAMKVFKLISMLMIACHWFGCIWFMISKYGGYDTNWASNSTDTDFMEEPWFTQYIAALYWACFTLTTVGYGDIYPTNNLEMAFATIVLFFGTCTYTVAIGNLEEIVAQLDVTSTLYQQKCERIKEYIKRRPISLATQEQVKSYLATIWETNCGVSGKTAMEMIPEPVQEDIRYHYCRDVIKEKSMMRHCSDPFLEAVIKAMDPESYLAGDMLFEKSAVSLEYYILVDGTVDYLSEKMASLKSLSGNQLLCENDFFTKVLRVCYCRAKTYCNTFVIGHKKFEHLLQNFPKDIHILEEKVRSSHTDSRDQLLSLEKNLGNAKLAAMMMTTEVANTHDDRIFKPESTVRRLWESLMAVVTVYNAILVPFRVAFYSFQTEDLDTLALYFVLFEFVIDASNYIDLYLKLNRFSTVFEGRTVTASKELQKLYLKNGFLSDFIKSFPLDLIVYFATGSFQNTSLCRLPRLIDLGSLAYRVQSAINFLEEESVKWSIGVWQSIKLFSLIILLSHWFACIFFTIGISSSEVATWLTEAGILDETVETQYTYALYWSVYTVTTVGFGDVKPSNNLERIYSIIVMMIGAVLCDAGLTAVLTALIDSKDSQSGQNVSRVECIRKYMAYRNFPVKLRVRVKEYLLYFSSSQGSQDENAILNEVSRQMRNRIVIDVCFSKMSTTSAFQGLASGLVRSIVQLMEPRVFLPREIIYRVGEIPHCMHLIVKGYVEIINNNEDGPSGGAFKQPGDVIGEFDQLTQYSNRAMTFVEVFSLDIHTYRECLKYASYETGHSTSPNKKAQSNRHSTSRTVRRFASMANLRNMLDTSTNKLMADGDESVLMKIHLSCDIIALITSWVFFLSVVLRMGNALISDESGTSGDVIVFDSLLYVTMMCALAVQLMYAHLQSWNVSIITRCICSLPLELVGYLLGLHSITLLIFTVPFLLHLFFTKKFMHSCKHLYLILLPEEEDEEESQKSEMRTFDSLAKSLFKTQLKGPGKYLQHQVMPDDGAAISGIARFKNAIIDVQAKIRQKSTDLLFRESFSGRSMSARSSSRKESLDQRGSDNTLVDKNGPMTRKRSQARSRSTTTLGEIAEFDSGHSEFQHESFMSTTSATDDVSDDGGPQDTVMDISEKHVTRPDERRTKPFYKKVNNKVHIAPSDTG